jgi:hypothetical protein
MKPQYPAEMRLTKLPHRSQSASRRRGMTPIKVGSGYFIKDVAGYLCVDLRDLRETILRKSARSAGDNFVDLREMLFLGKYYGCGKYSLF